MPSNLSEGWRRLGCSVEEFFYGTHMGKSWDNAGLCENRAINTQLLSTARRLKSEGRLDLIFAVIYDDVLDVETARQLRKLDVPMVNYHVDMVGQWYRVLKTGKYFDLVACAQRDNWEGLRKAGIRPYYMPMAANPPLTPDSADVSHFAFEGVRYLGSPWKYRCQVLGELAVQEIPLEIYGHNWLSTNPDPANAQPFRKNMHDIRYYALPRLQVDGAASLITSIRNRFRRYRVPSEAAPDLPDTHIKGVYADKDFIPLVRGVAINLGFTHFKGVSGTTSEQRQIRLREFEIPLAGGFYLTQDCAQLRELFAVGQHLEAWNSTDDLKEKVLYYLDHPDDRRKIAQAGLAHCLQNHTWENRFRELLKEFNMSPPRAA